MVTALIYTPYVYSVVNIQGELKGKRGLVPSNFMEEVSEEQTEREERGSGGMEIFAASEEDIEQAKRVIAEVSKASRVSCVH